LERGWLGERLKSFEGKALEMQAESTPRRIRKLAYWPSSI